MLYTISDLSLKVQHLVRTHHESSERFVWERLVDLDAGRYCAKDLHRLYQMKKHLRDGCW